MKVQPKGFLHKMLRQQAARRVSVEGVDLQSNHDERQQPSAVRPSPVEGQPPPPSASWIFGIHSPIAMSWGHFSSHSPQAAQTSARSPAGSHIEYLKRGPLELPYITLSLYRSMLEGMLTPLGQGMQ